MTKVQQTNRRIIAPIKTAISPVKLVQPKSTHVPVGKSFVPPHPQQIKFRT